MGVIAWIVLGIIVGAIAERFVSGRKSHGTVVTCLIGVTGALPGARCRPGAGKWSVSRWRVSSSPSAGVRLWRPSRPGLPCWYRTCQPAGDTFGLPAGGTGALLRFIAAAMLIMCASLRRRASDLLRRPVARPRLPRDLSPTAP